MPNAASCIPPIIFTMSTIVAHPSGASPPGINLHKIRTKAVNKSRCKHKNTHNVVRCKGDVENPVATLSQILNDLYRL